MEAVRPSLLQKHILLLYLVSFSCEKKENSLSHESERMS